ncbi:MAG: hypothetical protein ACLVG1_10105 [Monoglobus pectinilyticus]
MRVKIIKRKYAQTVGAVKTYFQIKATHIMRPNKLIVAWLYPIFRK